jgi:phosphoribosylformylglycinamidine cyclo-ligase
LPSTGLHTNGYSLARKLLLERGVDEVIPELGCTVGEELLKVHRSYLKPIRALADAGLLHGAAHITGGGITDNTPRMLPDDMAAAIDTSAWTIPPVFELMRSLGNIPDEDYRRTFNLGVGMILAVPQKRRKAAEKLLRKLGETWFELGKVVPRKRRGPRVEYR